MDPTSRFTNRLFPAYRHVPGQTPHPIRSPQGHSYRPNGEEESPQPDLNRTAALDCEEFLFGLDLFNERYWWECHEVMEQFWHASGMGTPAGHILQAVIQCAAAHLKYATAQHGGAKKLFVMAEDHVRQAGEINMGLDLIGMLADTGAFVSGDSADPARLRLLGTARSGHDR
jgi:uncharacterized protein